MTKWAGVSVSLNIVIYEALGCVIQAARLLCNWNSLIIISREYVPVVYTLREIKEQYNFLYAASSCIMQLLLRYKTFAVLLHHASINFIQPLVPR